MYFTNVTTKATALAIVAMAASHVAMTGVAAAPVTLSQADYLRNGQDAQHANKQFEDMTVQDPCNAGEKACIGGNFANCSPENDWEVTPCPTSLRCFSVPTKSGTAISCATQDDAQAWIADTGAKGGINGDDSSDDHGHNKGDGDEVSSTLVATTTDSAVETGTSSTDLPTATSTPAADIPGISIPLGDALSDKLPTATTDAAAATSTLSGTELTDSLTASTTCSTSTATATDASDGSSTDSTSASSSAARFTTRVTTTVVVTATEYSTTGVSESSMAQDAGTAPSLVTFTTHPFSPIPVSASTSAYDATSTSDGSASTSAYYATSTSDGYIIGSTSSSAAPVANTSPTQSVSFITQSEAQVFPIGGTISTITLSDLPVEPASSSTTGDAPVYSYVPPSPYASDVPSSSYSNDAPAYSYSSEPSIPPMGAAPTAAGDAVIVLPPHFTPL